MASPENAPDPSDPQPYADERPQFAERAFRSGAGVACGVLLLALELWLGGDAVIYGDGHTPWLALAGMLLGTPLVIAFTLRPAVFAGEDRLRVRNPFRMVTVPWGAVEAVRAGYSTELLAGGRKYQLWAIPVSLRARKRAVRQSARATAPADPFRGAGRATAHVPAEPAPAWADQAVEDLRGLAERNADRESARGEVVVRWAYEVIAPAAAGAVVLGILLAMG